MLDIFCIFSAVPWRYFDNGSIMKRAAELHEERMDLGMADISKNGRYCRYCENRVIGWRSVVKVLFKWYCS